MKIYNDLILNTIMNLLLTTLMKIFKLLAILKNKDIIDTLQTLYQQKDGLFFFAAIAIWPDIVFALSQFLQFNQ